jgi:hypothetical protein
MERCQIAKTLLSHYKTECEYVISKKVIITLIALYIMTKHLDQAKAESKKSRKFNLDILVR